jgi:hypothetical protein
MSCSCLLHGSGFGAVSYVEYRGKSQVLNGNYRGTANYVKGLKKCEKKKSMVGGDHITYDCDTHIHWKIGCRGNKWGGIDVYSSSDWLPVLVSGAAT